MDSINFFFQNNLDAVFLIYGLAFIVMGIAVLVQPREKSEFAIANILWLLALFGITHGTNELLDMWTIIKGSNPASDVIRWFMLAVSYIFLFEFGRQFFCIAVYNTNSWQNKFSRLLIWWLTPVISVFIIVVSFISSDLWRTGSIWIRYLFGFPGGLLISYGGFLYFKLKKEAFASLNIEKHIRAIGISFLFYGILGGLIVPKGNFFPSNFVNNDSFLNIVHIPVQVFRAICAIVVAWGISGMLKIFNWEIRTKLEEAQVMLKQQLKETEKSYMEVVDNSSDMIYFIDTENYIIRSNKQGYNFLGYLKTELLNKNLKEICTSKLWKDIENGLQQVKQEGIFFIDRGNIIKKDGEKLDITIHLVPIYDTKKTFLGTRCIIRDITKRLKIEEEQSKRVKELEEFYTMAIGRELKMVELKTEIDRLNKELKNKNP